MNNLQNTLSSFSNSIYIFLGHEDELNDDDCCSTFVVLLLSLSLRQIRSNLTACITGHEGERVFLTQIIFVIM